MTDKLSEYKKLRKAGSTPEPGLSHKDSATSSGKGNRFVIQEHHATSMHWDLRLERNGVLVSWAIPKGIPEDPRVNRLAVHVEDHPLSYIDFAGEIPAGEYGAGEVTIWDHGTYETEKFRDDEVIVTFAGERTVGRYVLFQTKGKNWMIHRMDPPLDPTRELMPSQLDVMTATSGELPSNEDNYAFEIKWDGIRALAFSEHGHLTLQGRRNYSDITSRYPELRSFARKLGSHDAIFDGEIVSLNAEGHPSFQQLQERMNLTSSSMIRRLAESAPVTYIVFDLLFLNGHSTMELSYVDRRRLLAQLEIDDPHWKVPDYRVGQGEELLAASRQLGLEGVIAKRLDSTYQPGKRSGSWIKIKNRLRQEFVVGGYMPGRGTRENLVGSLALGVWDAEGQFKFTGKVGSGFDETTVRYLMEVLKPLTTQTSPFEGRQPPKDTVFVSPELVVEVAFSDWTMDGSIRNGVYFGIRDDKGPAEVFRED